MTDTEQQILEKAATLSEPAKAAVRAAWSAAEKVRAAQATNDATCAKWARLETALQRRSAMIEAIEAAYSDAAARFKSTGDLDREIESAAQALGIAVGRFQVSRGDLIAAFDCRLNDRTFNLLDGQRTLSATLLSRRAEDKGAVAKSLADALAEKERAESASNLKRTTAAKLLSGGQPGAA